MSRRQSCSVYRTFPFTFADDNRSIDIVAMSCVFSGAPRSGKTTVIKRLKGETVNINEMTPSTGVVGDRGAVRINILPSCNIVTDQEWIEMEEDDEVQAFLNLTIIPVDITPVEKEPEGDTTESPLEIPSKTGAEPQQASPKAFEPLTDFEPPKAAIEVVTKPLQAVKHPDPVIEPHKAVVKPTMQEIVHLDPGTSELPNKRKPRKDKGLPSPGNVLKKALVHSQQIRATKRLCKRYFLHLVDTGGQTEFRKIAPLIVSGPSITFIVFRLIDELNKILVSKFCPSNSEGEVDSYYCVRDTIKDIIENIYCTEITAKVRGLIMFIGTHKDCLNESIREQTIEKRNNELIKILQECLHFEEDMVIKSENKRFIFCVNNSVLELEHKCIKSKILNLCQTERFKVSAKPEQLLLALTLKGAKQVVLTLSEYEQISKMCGVKETEKQNTLSLLQEKLLLIRRIELKEGTIIIVKPKVLNNKISLLLTKCKFRPSKPLISTTELREIAEEGKVIGEDIEPDIFINILIYLLIIAPVIDTSGGNYIVPSILIHCKPHLANPSWFSTSLPSVKSDEVLFTFSSFHYSIPSVLHNLILCSLIQTSQWHNDITRLLETSSLLLADATSSLLYKMEVFQECVSISTVEEPNESSVVFLKCENVKIEVYNGLSRAVKLVGFGQQNPLKHCSYCFHHYVFSAVLKNCSCSDTDPVSDDVICFFKG